MDQLSIALLLDYLYNKFAITFVFSLVGTSIKDIAVVSKTNTARFKLKTLVATSTFSTIVLCAIGEYFKVSFSIYALICVLGGMWSNKVLQMATNNKFMSKFLANLLKRISSPITGAISDTLEPTKKPNNKGSTKSNEESGANTTREKHTPVE